MSPLLETLVYQVGQMFLIPTLAIIALLFLYALQALGSFLACWWRRRGRAPGRETHDLRHFDLLRWAAGHPAAQGDEWDVAVRRLLETPRIVSIVAPTMGLVAAMILMGPALRDLADGDFSALPDRLSMAFAAMIVALVTASIMFLIVSVRRRWLAEELAWLRSLAPLSEPVLILAGPTPQEEQEWDETPVVRRVRAVA
ncbi:MotA/TolQ/ExbB proton channel domain-containing protein OS=Castellaniella defragrans OX=75697 GN=HNR28_002171 PE=3 SV=1 [Castellaniella denitrificans]|uniref:MotA/TolQ/ExbB proton channel family protein n=1 Tax=Castellaniella sp. TaxID=1955812 RepID=UPI002AFE2AD7|nr:MotA/TolQ/ExbB proton channel family protein [Castellaniella sp.]